VVRRGGRDRSPGDRGAHLRLALGRDATRLRRASLPVGRHPRPGLRRQLSHGRFSRRAQGPRTPRTRPRALPRAGPGEWRRGAVRRALPRLLRRLDDLPGRGLPAREPATPRTRRVRPLPRDRQGRARLAARRSAPSSRALALDGLGSGARASGPRLVPRPAHPEPARAGGRPAWPLAQRRTRGRTRAPAHLPRALARRPGSRGPQERSRARDLARPRRAAHGAGLCQVGSHEYALRGWTAPTILGHYLPGAFLVDLPPAPAAVEGRG
jgi:hypothetical protein